MTRARLLAASCLLLCALLAPAAAAQAEPYGNETATANDDDWTDDRSTVDLVNVSHYVSRVGTFVVGSDPGDPGAGPLLTGLLALGLSLATLGTSRAGVVASGAAGIVVVAALADGAGLLPGWLYGVAVLTVALLGAGIYTRLLR
jgi:hypothetical protein